MEIVSIQEEKIKIIFSKEDKNENSKTNNVRRDMFRCR